MLDPTREELLTYLTLCAGPFDDGDGLNFDAEQAAYWLACDFHGGQASNLYAALCASPYRPGLIENGPDGEIAAELYNEGAAWLRGDNDCLLPLERDRRPRNKEEN